MNNKNKQSWKPEVDKIYTGEVIDVLNHGAMVRLKGFGGGRGRREFKGLLHNKDSPIVEKLIDGHKVKVRVIAFMPDGFISITTKDIEQPENETVNVFDEAYEKQRQKIRVMSPERRDVNQFTTPKSVSIEVITTEPDFLKNVNLRIPSRIPTKISIYKNENSFMAEVAKEKSKNNQDLKFQRGSFDSKWIDPVRMNSQATESFENSTQPEPMKNRNLMSITEQRESLPIFKFRNEIIRSVVENQFLIIQGETGSGKTTQVAQYLFEGGLNLKGKIACTQPRRVAAVTVAKRVAEEYGCILGQEVGYKIRFVDMTSPNTVIKYMTDGILLRECLSDANLDNYSVIILDEAHERSIYTDVLFGVLKKAAKRRPKLRVVISSATLNTDQFSKFFNNAKVLKIPGKMFPVEIKYQANPVRDYFNAAVNTVLNIHLQEPEGDILCFLTGQDEIDYACEIIDEIAEADDENFGNLYAYALYSALPFEEQFEIFSQIAEGNRKVIFATNIAETSMTIDGVVYVVDPGYVKQKVYDAKTGFESLIVVPISKASADQRCGRAGRVMPGKCFRIYTESAYENEMLEVNVPDIQRSNLSNVVLHLKSIGVRDILNFDFMDPPSRDFLIAALKELYLLEALDSDEKVTPMGRRMNQFPVEPNYAKMLLVSDHIKCTDEIVTIIAMLSVQNIFYSPKKNKHLANEKKDSFNHPVGDHLRLWNVYKKWEMNYKKNPRWCKNHFVNEKKLHEAYEVRKNLLEILQSRNFDIYSAGKNIERIQLAICVGFFKNIAHKAPSSIFRNKNDKSYRTLEENPEIVYINRSSCLFYQLPEWVVYNNIRETSKKFFQEITVINPNWLPYIAKGMYRRKDNDDKDNEEKLIKAFVEAQSAKEYKF
ncbi:hypothetical protein PVAND_016608 [Polypedilum vanderplanki]|uniref:RNA helicase n=1 Tax=Polypedilum vanderplanki TaxID=319348 RepID=A0A9J6BFX3_POLVA|nr:hypothetical protein PVAND_016608 [Polypedilum vanderplanki]